jgi:hypothetical protein
MSKMYTLYAYLFYAAALSSFCGLLKAADQKYPFDPVDRFLFRDPEASSDNCKRVKALYSTAFINSVSDESSATIEREPLFSLYKSAAKKTTQPTQTLENEIDYFKLRMNHQTFHDFDKKNFISQTFDRADCINTWVSEACTFLFAPDNEITMKDKMILLLLQNGIHAIKRTAEKLEITLRVDTENRPLLKP